MINVLFSFKSLLLNEKYENKISVVFIFGAKNYCIFYSPIFELKQQKFHHFISFLYFWRPFTGTPNPLLFSRISENEI